MCKDKDIAKKVDDLVFRSKRLAGCVFVKEQMLKKLEIEWYKKQ